MEFRACPKRGSLNIRQSAYQDGLVFSPAGGKIVRYECDDCSYSGMPILFDSMKDYKKFIRELKK